MPNPRARDLVYATLGVFLILAARDYCSACREYQWGGRRMFSRLRTEVLQT